MYWILWLVSVYFAGIVAIVCDVNERQRNAKLKDWIAGVKWPGIAFLELVRLLAKAKRRWID